MVKLNGDPTDFGEQRTVTDELDSKSRVQIPARVRYAADFDITSTEMAFQLHGPGEAKHPRVPVTTDSQGRFVVPKLIRKISGVSPGDEITFSVYEVSE